MGDTLNLLAKTVIENIGHECTNQGCDRRLSYQEVTRHKEELCKYRMVRCPGENPECKATLPFSAFNDHIKVCKSLFPVNAKSMTSSFNQNLLDGDTINWKPAIFNINNEVFVVQRKLADSKFIFAVSMLAGRNKCDRFMVTLSNNKKNDDPGN